MKVTKNFSYKSTGLCYNGPQDAGDGSYFDLFTITEPSSPAYLSTLAPKSLLAMGYTENDLNLAKGI